MLILNLIHLLTTLILNLEHNIFSSSIYRYYQLIRMSMLVLMLKAQGEYFKEDERKIKEPRPGKCLLKLKIF